MEIIYIHIENDGKNIHECEFNFSPHYRFHYNKEQNIIDGDITEDYVENFWESTNIKNITAIIGKNGTGKSNLLEFIVRYFASGIDLENEYKRNVILIYRHNNRLYVNRKDIQCSIKLEEKDYIQYPLNDFNRDVNTKIIYYSRSYDRDILKKNKHSAAYFKDISDSYHLRRISDFKRYMYLKKNSISILGDIDIMKLEDTFRHLELFKFCMHRMPVDIRIPDIVKFRVHGDGVKIDIDNVIYTRFFIAKEKEELSFLEVIQNLILNQIFLNIRKNDEILCNEYLIFADFVSNTYAGGFYKELVKLYNSGYIIYEDKKIRGGSSKPLYPFFEFRIKLINISFDFLYHLYHYYFSADVFFGLGSLDIYQISQLNISIHWDGLSTGELEYFNLFSRILHSLQNVRIDHDNKKKIQISNKKEENIILFLDEPEVAFHPDWQRCLLNDIILFCKNVFSSYNFQIIITSHSPILVSDFPKKNIIFLDKKSNGDCVVLESITRENTFAANIHTLYKNSFFLDGLPIGEFARKKINKIFDAINENKLNNDIYQEILIVGEPILRNELMKMYNQLLPQSLNDRLFQIEQDLKEIKQKKK